MPAQLLPCHEGSVITAERSDFPHYLLWRSREAQNRDLRSKLGLESVCSGARVIFLSVPATQAKRPPASTGTCQFPIDETEILGDLRRSQEVNIC